MNIVEAIEQEPPQEPLTQGSIWRRNNKGDFYCLQKIEGLYLLACLDDGEPYGNWVDADETMQNLTRFTRVHGTVTITQQP